MFLSCDSHVCVPDDMKHGTVLRLQASQSLNATTLFTNATCPFAQQVDIALQELNMKVTRVPINIFDFPDPSFANLYNNAYPNAPRRPSVPLLQIVATTPTSSNTTVSNIAESSVILQYLEDMQLTPTLIPTSPAHRATMRLIVIAFQSTVAPSISNILNSTSVDQLTVAMGTLKQGFACLEAILQQQQQAQEQEEQKEGNTPQFLFGSHFTLAEISVAPHLQRLFQVVPILRPELNVCFKESSMMEFTRASFPSLATWIHALLSRQSVQTSFDLDQVVAVKSKAVATWKKKPTILTPTLVVSGVTDEPGLNGEFQLSGTYKNSPQWNKPGSRIYIRYSLERWNGFALYVSHHKKNATGETGTTFFTHVGPESPETWSHPPTAGWVPTLCSLPGDVLCIAPASSGPEEATTQPQLNKKQLMVHMTNKQRSAPVAVHVRYVGTENSESQEEEKQSTTAQVVYVLPSLTGLQMKSKIIAELGLNGGFSDYYLRCENISFGSKTGVQEHPCFKEGCVLVLEDLEGRPKAVGET